MARSVLAIALGLSLVAGGALAQSAGAKAAVDSAKATGVVGEQADGFLGLVTGSAPPDVKSAVAEINAGRAKAYADIASKTGVTVGAAGEATARQLQSRLPAGQYFKPEEGSWTRK